MNFKTYLTEFQTYKKQTRSVELSKDQIIKLLKSGDYDTALKNKTKIYRGVNLKPDYVVIDPTKFTRLSANTANIYMTLLDTFESWKDYPKRSKSLICSTSYDTANKYGHLYIVLPKNDAKIGICPKNDIWSSFYRTIDTDLHSFNYTLNEYILKLIENEFKFKFNQNYGVKLINILKSIRSINKIKDQCYINIKNKQIELEKYIMKSMFTDFIDNNKYNNLYDYVETLFDPVKNHFKLINIKYLDNVVDNYSSRECWTDSKSLLIYKESYDKLLKDGLI